MEFWTTFVVLWVLQMFVCGSIWVHLQNKKLKDNPETVKVIVTNLVNQEDMSRHDAEEAVQLLYEMTYFQKLKLYGPYIFIFRDTFLYITNYFKTIQQVNRGN